MDTLQNCFMDAFITQFRKTSIEFRRNFSKFLKKSLRYFSMIVSLRAYSEFSLKIPPKKSLNKIFHWFLKKKSVMDAFKNLNGNSLYGFLQRLIQRFFKKIRYISKTPQSVPLEFKQSFEVSYRNSSKV